MADDLTKRLTIEFGLAGEDKLQKAEATLKTLQDKLKELNAAFNTSEYNEKAADAVRKRIDAKTKEIEVTRQVLALEKAVSETQAESSEKLKEYQNRFQQFDTQLKNWKVNWQQFNPLNRAVNTAQTNLQDARTNLQETLAKGTELNARYKTSQGLKNAAWEKLQTLDKSLAPEEYKETEDAYNRYKKEEEDLQPEIEKSDKDLKTAEENLGTAEKGSTKATIARGVAEEAAKSLKKIVSTIGNGLSTAFQSVLGISLSIKQNFRDILQDVSKITNMYSGMATYSSSSLTVNSTARNTMLTYGMTGSQAYAFNQTKSMLGIQTDEDLLYMTDTQKSLFSSYMEKQQSWYNKLESSGVLESVQTLQLDFAMFKQEIAVDFLEWIAENKGTIMSLFKTGINILKAIIQTLGKVLTFFGADTYDMSYGANTSTVSDVISTSQLNQANKTVTIKMTNNVNGMFNETELTDFISGKLQSAVQSAAVSLGG